MAISGSKVPNQDAYPPTSRYKSARYYQRDIPGIGLRIEPETWEAPEFEITDNYLLTKVAAGEEGRLDLVAYRVYRIDSLWWVLALVNNIVDPFEEVTVGMELKYPPFDTVAARVLA